MSKRTLLYCPHCQTGLRLPIGNSGFVICPKCENKVKADTTALGLALLEAWWVPKWYWLILVLIAIYGFLFWAASDGFNHMRGLSAMFWGGVGGGVGALLGGLIKHWKQEAAWMTAILSSLGFIAGTLASKGITAITQEFVSEEFTFQVVTGAAAGSLVGLILHFGLLRRNPRFGSMAFWLCVFIGSFGGLVLSVPVAIGMYFYGRHKFKLVEG